jgi:hypothetical protein
MFQLLVMPVGRERYSDPKSFLLNTLHCRYFFLFKISIAFHTYGQVHVHESTHLHTYISPPQHIMVGVIVLTESLLTKR